MRTSLLYATKTIALIKGGFIYFTVTVQHLSDRNENNKNINASQ